MSEQGDRDRAGPTPFVIAVTLVAIVVAVVAALAINNANTLTPVGAVTPAPTSPTISPVPVPSTPCAGKQFGAPLAPLNPPSDPHVYPVPPPTSIDATKLYHVVLHTTRGEISLCLDPGLAPLTVNNFVTLVRNHFYDGDVIHRVEPGFVIQMGDPACKDARQTTCGQGGPGYSFKDEPVKGQYTPGCLAMANSGPDTNGSQFYICTADDSTRLQPNYNYFGQVDSGLNVALAEQKGDVITTATVSEST